MTVADEETSIVKEIPCLDVGTDAGSPDYSKDDNSDSTIIEGSSHFPMDHLSSLPLSSTTGSRTSTIITPEKNVNSNSIPEMESYLNLSVNSHNQKRRKPMITPFINLIEEENDVAPCASTPTRYTKSSVDVRYATHGTECGSGRILNSYSPQLPTSILPGSCSLTVPLLDKRLQIFCSLCKNPLGRPENHLYLTCSLISSSKVHLRSLLEQRLKTYTTDTAKSVPVIVTDSSFVDQHICNRIPKSALEEGIWCPEDGCVFRSIFCPFCSNTNNLLGVQIMATNSSNVQLLDKVTFTTNISQLSFTWENIISIIFPLHFLQYFAFGEISNTLLCVYHLNFIYFPKSILMEEIGRKRNGEDLFPFHLCLNLNVPLFGISTGPAPAPAMSTFSIAVLLFVVLTNIFSSDIVLL